MASRLNLLTLPSGGNGYGSFMPTIPLPTTFNIPTATNPTATPGGYLPQIGTGAPWWVDLINVGLGIAAPFLPGATPAGGTITTMPGATPASAASVVAALAALGIRVIGTVIRTTRALWSKVPDTLKSAALALGLTLLFDDDGDGNGMPKRRRARGITGAELRGFKKVGGLLKKWGMRPKMLGASRRRVCK